MGQIQQQITSALGGFFGSGSVQTVLKIVAIYWLAIWIACAFWVYRDMRSRTEEPMLPYLAAALVILFTPVFFPMAILVYRIVRPADRVLDRREHELNEALLMSEVGEIEQCASCRRVVDPSWMICPNCRGELRDRCGECGRVAEFDWRHCAWCGNDLTRARGRRDREGAPARERVPVMDEQAATRGAAGWQLKQPRVALAGGSAPARGAEEPARARRR